MDTLKISNKDVSELIKEHISLFDLFECVYLFGSSLDANIIYNDIDILTIYASYSSEIACKLNRISIELEKATGAHIDLTALSIEEERDIHFLEKIKPNYLKLK